MLFFSISNCHVRIHTTSGVWRELERADLISSITISVCDIVGYSYLSLVPAITTTNLFIPSNLNSLLFSPA